MSWSVCPRPRNRRADPSTADVHVGRLDERPIRRIDHDLGQIRGDLGVLRGDPGAARLAGPAQERHATGMSPDRRRSEDAVAEGVVEVTVRVDHDRCGPRREVAKIRHDLASLCVGRARVDDDDVVATQDHPDVLVEERIASDEYPIADLDPAVHARMVSMCGPTLGVDKQLSTH